MISMLDMTWVVVTMGVVLVLLAVAPLIVIRAVGAHRGRLVGAAVDDVDEPATAELSDDEADARIEAHVEDQLRSWHESRARLER